MKGRSVSTARASRLLPAQLNAAPSLAQGEEAAALDRQGRSLGDLARDRFLAALFERRIEPGSFVSQNELVKILGVPVGPLRDALRVLQAEGWLVIHARSGIELRKPDFELVRNSYQMRLILERAAVRTYAEVAPLARIAEQEERHREVIERVRGQELSLETARELEAFDFGFHLEVVGILANPLISAAYSQAQRFVQLVRLDREFQLSAPLVARTVTEHLDILRACRARDPVAAEAALEVHFSRAMQRAIGFF
ncbi:MAG: GntR family transcriptional regulator [Alsobacter sp.]